MAAADTSNVGAELGVFSAVLSYEDVQTAFSAEHTVSVHSQTTTPTSVLVYFDLDGRSPSNMSVAAIYKERSGRIMVR